MYLGVCASITREIESMYYVRMYLFIYIYIYIYIYIKCSVSQISLRNLEVKSL